MSALHGRCLVRGAVIRPLPRRSVTPAGDRVSASCRRARQWGSSGSRWERKQCDAGVSAGGPGTAGGARGAGRRARGRVAGSSGHARAFLRGDQGRLGGGGAGDSSWDAVAMPGEG